MTRSARPNPRPNDAPEQRPSFAAIARDHVERLYGDCLRLTSDPADAEDLVQETLLHGMRAYDDLREPASEKVAVRDRDQRLAGRLVPGDARSGPAHRPPEGMTILLALSDDRHGGPFPTRTSSTSTSCGCSGRGCPRVFGSMTPAFRLPLILTVVHGFSCKEAAAILEIPLGTLLSRLHRGRKQLERGLWDYAVANSLVTAADGDRP